MSAVLSTRILYMEDDPDQARLFKRRLENAGYDVNIAKDGREGLAMYQPGEYDVIVVDQRMPFYDGLEVMRILRERETVLPPMIMVTAVGNEKLVVEAMKLGASDYIVKDGAGGYLKLLPSVIDQALQRQQLIEEKRQAEKTTARLSAIIEATTDFVGISNIEGEILHINQAGRQMLGLGQDEEISGLKMSDCFADWTKRLVDTEGPQTAIKEGVWSGETALVSRTGEEIPMSHVILVHKSPDGEVEFFSSIARDISERKLVEQTLLRSREVLEERVKERTAELSEANKILQEEISKRKQTEREQQKLIEELDSFAHTVAHDLKGPLSLMLGFSELLETDYATLSQEQLIRSFKSIAKSGRKMRKIIDDLLLLAGARQRENITVEPLNMSLIVTEAQGRLQHIIEQRQAQIVLPDEWPIAIGYGPWIEEVWANYLSNALRYGGHPPLIELGGDYQANNMVRFWIRDNGPGISPEDQARLFIPFTKLNYANNKGHGLGLSIVQRIVQKLGGKVDVQSQGIAGEGSTFSFTLPAGTKTSMDIES